MDYIAPGQCALPLTGREIYAWLRSFVTRDCFGAPFMLRGSGPAYFPRIRPEKVMQFPKWAR